MSDSQKALTNHEQGLREILTEHRGPENAITSKELGERLGVDQSNGNPETRFGIRSLIRKTGLPIGACSDGYYVIESSEQMVNYLERLDQRIAGIETRKSLVQTAFVSDEIQQTIFEYDR